MYKYVYLQLCVMDICRPDECLGSLLDMLNAWAPTCLRLDMRGINHFGVIMGVVLCQGQNFEGTVQLICPGRNSEHRISFCFVHLQTRAVLIYPILIQTAHSVFCASDLSTPPVCSSSPARALFYLQNFECSIDFKAFADLLGSLIVDLVVADVQVNQHTVNFESFC